MGIISWPEPVPDWGHPDDAHEVGVLPLTFPLSSVFPPPSACQILLDREPRFGEEVGLTATFAPLSVEYRRTPAGAAPTLEAHQLWRFTLKVDSKSSPIEADDVLFLSGFPYATGYTQQAVFKGPCKKGARDRTRYHFDPTSPDEALDSPEALLAWLERRSVDVFAKGDYLTADISVPSKPAPPTGKTRIYHEQALLVLGVCKGVVNIEKLVSNLRDSAEVQRLLEQTENRHIRFCYRGEGGPEPKRLYDSVASQANELIELSIRQALAGPVPDLSTSKRSERVVDLIDWIYRAHLNNLNRQEWQRRKKLEQGGQQVESLPDNRRGARASEDREHAEASVARLLAHLKPLEREVVRLRAGLDNHGKGLAFSEIDQQLCIPRGGAEQLYRRAMSQLRQLGDDQDSPLG